MSRDGSPQNGSLSVPPFEFTEAPLPPDSGDWDTCRADGYYTADERDELAPQVWNDRLAAIQAYKELIAAGEFRWRKGKTLVGCGTHGLVWEAIRGDTGELIVAKEVITERTGLERSKFQDLHHEINVLRSLSHPHVVKYLGCTIMQDRLCILMEYCSGGSIAACLKTFGALMEPVVRSFAFQILSGLGFLHRQCIVHRDVKTGNLLLSTDGVVKLADFGASKHLMDCSGSLKGTYQYMAPEALRGETGRCSDIWSVGICVDEMLRGQINTSVDRGRNLVAWDDHVRTQAAPDPPEHASDDAKDFLRACLVVEPRDRPNAYRLSQHHFVVCEGVPPSGARERSDSLDSHSLSAHSHTALAHSRTPPAHSRTASAHSAASRATAASRTPSTASRVPSTALRAPSSGSILSRESPELVEPCFEGSSLRSLLPIISTPYERRDEDGVVDCGDSKILASYRFPAFETSKFMVGRKPDTAVRNGTQGYTDPDPGSDAQSRGSTLLGTFDTLMSRQVSGATQMGTIDRLALEPTSSSPMQSVWQSNTSPMGKPSKARKAREAVAIASGLDMDDPSPLASRCTFSNSLNSSHIPSFGASREDICAHRTSSENDTQVIDRLKSGSHDHDRLKSGSHDHDRLKSVCHDHDRLKSGSHDHDMVQRAGSFPSTKRASPLRRRIRSLSGSDESHEPRSMEASQDTLDDSGLYLLPARLLDRLGTFFECINLWLVLWAFIHRQGSALYDRSPKLRSFLSPIVWIRRYLVGEPHPALRTTWCIVNTLADPESEQEFMRTFAPWSRRKIAEVGMFFIFCLGCRASISVYWYFEVEDPPPSALLRVVLDLCMIACFVILLFFPSRDPLKACMSIEKIARLLVPLGILVTFGEPEMMSLLRILCFVLKSWTLLGGGRDYAVHCGLAVLVRSAFCIQKIFTVCYTGGLSWDALFSVVGRELSSIFVIASFYVVGLYVVIRAHRDRRVRWFEKKRQVRTPPGSGVVDVTEASNGPSRARS